MHRFFLPPDHFSETRARLTRDVAEQTRKVLRLRPGDALTLLDGLGHEYHAILQTYGKDDAWAEIRSREAVTTEPRVLISLFLSVLNKPDKFEWALQKCTELGTARFVPLLSERSISESPSAARRERWERIIREAAEQSGRGLLPVLGDPMKLLDLLNSKVPSLELANDGSSLALIPEIGQRMTFHATLSDLVRAPQTVSLFIGPEGGFTPGEVTRAVEAGVVGVTLGPRILRSETAAVAAVALIMSELGEMS
jgi:16S rRNA (uracil1498-N3)-methyltransferase